MDRTDRIWNDVSHVIDEIKDPRELAEELREALNPSTTIDEKISFLEEIAAQNGGQL